MRYIVRLNPRAFNPITRTVIASRLWEVEQCATKDSAKVVWHCADVCIDKTPIRELFKLSKEDEKPWEGEYWGVVVRTQDNAIAILTGPMDASGN